MKLEVGDKVYITRADSFTENGTNMFIVGGPVWATWTGGCWLGCHMQGPGSVRYRWSREQLISAQPRTNIHCIAEQLEAEGAYDA